MRQKSWNSFPGISGWHIEWAHPRTRTCLYNVCCCLWNQVPFVLSSTYKVNRHYPEKPLDILATQTGGWKEKLKILVTFSFYLLPFPLRSYWLVFHLLIITSLPTKWHNTTKLYPFGLSVEPSRAFTRRYVADFKLKRNWNRIEKQGNCHVVTSESFSLCCCDASPSCRH